jgi:hypothetical protein
LHDAARTEQHEHGDHNGYFALRAAVPSGGAIMLNEPTRMTIGRLVADLARLHCALLYQRRSSHSLQLRRRELIAAIDRTTISLALARRFP